MEPYCIPRLEEVLSKIDLTKGFHQVKVRECDREKLCFVSPFGMWQYVRMPFGVASAPATFQRLMDLVLQDCNHYSSCYIDDVLIQSKDWKQHLVDLETVLQALSKAGLTCKPAKCQFGRRQLLFLGHVINW